jgi:excisionase family DNA binding protein
MSLMTVKDAALSLCVHTNTIRRMVKVGKLRTVIVGAGGRSVRVLAEDVNRITNPTKASVYVAGSLKRKLK